MPVLRIQLQPARRGHRLPRAARRRRPGIAPRSLIRTVLLQPEQAASLPLSDWDLLIRQARSANLLARLADDLRQRGLLAQVPHGPRQHLDSALAIAASQRRTTHWELQCIQSEVDGSTRTLVVLKGAAYLALALPHSSSRLFTDLDVMVRHAELDQVEAALLRHGWRGKPMTPYDQRYYRRWMHEVPPMEHVRRGTALDLHHTILPITARIKIDAARLFEHLRPLPTWPGLHVLEPAAMFLHSATHLFHEGELDNGLRDLFDLDALARTFSAEPSFWPALLERAGQLGLQRPLYYALRYTTELLGTPVPPEVLQAAAARGAPGPLGRRVMDFCYRHALQPVHPSCDTRRTRRARLMLYLRAHWIRMPLHLLGVHLARKAWMRLFPVDDAAAAEKKAGAAGQP